MKHYTRWVAISESRPPSRFRSFAFSREIAIVLTLVALSVASHAAADVKMYKSMGYIVVSPSGPKDGAHFGPGTSGTKTAGIQEAVDYAGKHGKPVYIAGSAEPGALRNDARYTLKDTLRVPAAVGLKITSGGCVITYKKSTGDAIVFDSQVKSSFRLGVVRSESRDGAVVRVRPRSKVGSSGAGVRDCVFEINGVVGPGGAWQPPRSGASTGILLDGTSGEISGSRFAIIQAAGADKGCHLAGACVDNNIDLPLASSCNTHLQIGGAKDSRARRNRAAVHIDSFGVSGSAGVRVHGADNLLNVGVMQASKGRDIVFESGSKGNVVVAWELPDGVTHKPGSAGNVILKGLPDGIRAPIPAMDGQSQDLVDLCCYAVRAGIAGLWGASGKSDPAKVLASGTAGGERFEIKPGDRVMFNYAVFAPAFCTEVNEQRADEVRRLHVMNYVVVSPWGPADGADFGPYTPGTRTSGIQEALDHAKRHSRDVYICGGAMPVGFRCRAMYMTWDTIRVPSMQDFKLDGGEYLLIYQRPTGDAVVFDSSMSSRYKFGIVKSLSNGAVMKIQPRSSGVDGFSVVTMSEFKVNALVGGGGAWQLPDTKGEGVGLLLDATHGPVDGNAFWVQEIVGCDVGVALKGPCTNNKIDSQFIHMCQTGLRVGGPSDATSRHNTINVTVDPHQLADTTGAQVFGEANLLTLMVRASGEGKSLILEPSARDNLITAIALPNGITNNAAVPTNRITTAYPLGFDAVSSPAVPKSGEQLMNREPYTVKVIITSSGEVSAWTLTDGNGASRTIPAGLTPGQEITLEPADQVRFEYTSPPAWVWRAIR